GKRMKKICIDGGFSCPNRDGKCGTGGCICCGERGAGEHIDPTSSIGEQVRSALSMGAENDNFIAYFQNFTNTYAPVDILKERYDAALIDERIRILSIGTRPDCIDEDVCKLLAEYNKDREVWVELGLQTSSDLTASVIRRGYTLDVFKSAAALLKKYGIKTFVHMIIGLPGEGEDEALDTARTIAKIRPFGVKIHSIYVMEGTELARMYRENRYTPPSLDEYKSICAKVIATLPSDTVIHRITGDCPRSMLVAPDWNADKNEIIKRIQEELRLRGLRQGDLFEDQIRVIKYQ
ncbi:MAG: TIGR01212 family radical SAM protein, partial [Clostridia bacterium]|nr:TIGR01212 family radical SAM protein [Clostridia bacterium]